MLAIGLSLPSGRGVLHCTPGVVDATHQSAHPASAPTRRAATGRDLSPHRLGPARMTVTTPTKKRNGLPPVRVQRLAFRATPTEEEP
jgi:hypothetical protein